MVCFASFLSRFAAATSSNSPDLIWFGFFELFVIQFFNVLRKRKLPRFLAVVGQSAKLFWVQAQFSGHLDLGMGQAKTFPRIDPDHQVLRNLAWRFWALIIVSAIFSLGNHG